MSDLLLTAAQMRALEAAAIESGTITGLELMERAGTGAVAAIEAEWPELAATPGRAVVLCGPGNNGGDGFVVARVLAGKGWAVEVFLYGDADKLPPDARANCERWREMGQILAWDDVQVGNMVDAVYAERGMRHEDGEAGSDLVIDALFGIGQNRMMPDDTEQTWHGFVPSVFLTKSALGTRYVAIDMPSGVCSDSGRNLEGALEAHLTVTFQAAKLGQYLGDGPSHCGAIRVVGIGLREANLECTGEGRRLSPLNGGIVRLVSTADPSAVKLAGHKYDHGHALVLAGGMGRTGAARLAARAALRIGAGLVTVAAPGSAMMECAAQLTAIMLRRCDDGVALEALLEDDRLSALCLGPGLGTDARAAGLVATALAASHATVLDADALTLIAGDDALRGKLHDKCVLTPHGGEFARLFPDISARLMAPAATGPAFSKVDATREAAAEAGCTVLMKGPDTVIADPSGRASVNAAVYERAAPWLATAGAGDVLAGIIAGLLARGLSPHDAAAAAAWLHVEAARAFGPGLIAEDLPETLPAVFRMLRAETEASRHG